MPSYKSNCVFAQLRRDVPRRSWEITLYNIELVINTHFIIKFTFHLPKTSVDGSRLGCCRWCLVGFSQKSIGRWFFITRLIRLIFHHQVWILLTCICTIITVCVTVQCKYFLRVLLFNINVLKNVMLVKLYILLCVFLRLTLWYPIY